MGETDIALFSGGSDSLAATHHTMNEEGGDWVVYLDTTIGSDANREYVESVCDEYGWQLWTLRTHYNYDELVDRYGFPGPSKHSWFYRYLKERQLEKLARIPDLHLWTGVRKQESRNRMATVEPVKEADAWTWHAPLHDWSDMQVWEYIEEQELPESPLWASLGRSADCWCGAYANRNELIDGEAAGCEDVVNVIRDMEPLDREDRQYWAWHDDDKAAWAREDDEQSYLCGHCRWDYD